MAHFARVENDIVQEVLVVPNQEEHRGQEFLANDLGLGGQWVSDFLQQPHPQAICWHWLQV